MDLSAKNLKLCFNYATGLKRQSLQAFMINNFVSVCDVHAVCISYDGCSCTPRTTLIQGRNECVTKKRIMGARIRSSKKGSN